MSQTHNTDARSLTRLSMTTIGRRSMVEMQKNMVKRGKRNAFVRFILSKVDKDKIAAWNQELVRLLHVFNVRSINCVRNFANLTALFQAELAIDTNIRVADTQRIIGNTQTIVADTRVTVTNIEKKVGDIHLNMLPQDAGQADSCFLLTRAHITYSRILSFEQLPSRPSGRVSSR